MSLSTQLLKKTEAQQKKPRFKLGRAIRMCQPLNFHSFFFLHHIHTRNQLYRTRSAIQIRLHADINSNAQFVCRILCLFIYLVSKKKKFRPRTTKNRIWLQGIFFFSAASEVANNHPNANLFQSEINTKLLTSFWFGVVMNCDVAIFMFFPNCNFNNIYQMLRPAVWQHVTNIRPINLYMIRNGNARFIVLIFRFWFQFV